MSAVWIFAVSFLGAALSALGMGGGGILLIYLTAYEGADQLTAQGINLFFFLPVAAVALCIHIKNRLVRFRLALPCILTGLIGVFAGAQLAQWVGSPHLRKLFGVFLLIVGLREAFSKDKKISQKK